MKLPIEQLRTIAAELNGLADFRGGQFPLVIGGGAPRDAFLAGAVKDIDVFCDTRKLDDNAWRQFVERVIERYDGEIDGTAECSIGGPATTEIVTKALPPISLIPVNRCAFDDVHEYDFGICQVLVTPRGVLRTAAFDQDLARNEITYLHKAPNPQQLTRSTSRLMRILAKHPSLAPINCEALTACLR